MVPNGLCLKISTRAAMRVTISIVGAAAVCMSGTAIAADSGEKTVKSLCVQCHRIEGKPAPRKTKSAPDLI